MEDSKRSVSSSIHEIPDPSRRVVRLGGLGALIVGALAPWLAACAAAASASGGRLLIDFRSAPVGRKKAPDEFLRVG